MHYRTPDNNRILPAARAYRPDIDGLRAIAVTSVILYHFGIAPFSGGFVGVDVFFVISGFLITSIIHREMIAGTFSFANFFARRIKRIMPALVLVVSISLAAGYLLLLPGAFVSLSHQAAYSVIGGSNFYFLWNTGYFDEAADMLPLLHTWSLGVEEQFYVLWPPILLGLVTVFRGSKAVVIGFLASVIVISLTLSIITVREDINLAFYMVHTRAWEMAVGAILVFTPAVRGRIASELANFLGLGLIAFSVFALSTESLFPGENAIFPCLGAALLIWPKAERTAVALALSTKPFLAIGLLSYSLYLWHWPLLVFYRTYIYGAMPTMVEAMGLILATGLVSWVSYRWVETPARKTSLHKPAVIMAGVMSAAVIWATSNALVSANGLPERISDQMQAMRSPEIMWDWQCSGRVNLGIERPLCEFGDDWDTAEHRALLWGDSHAEHLSPIIQASDLAQGTSFAMPKGCAPTISNDYPAANPARPSLYDHCGDIHKQIVEMLQRSPDIDLVILSALWSGYLSYQTPAEGAEAQLSVFKASMTDLINSVRAPGREVVIVEDIPSFKGIDPVQCAVSEDGSLLRRHCWRPEVLRGEYEARNSGVNQIIRDIAGGMSNVQVVGAGEAMCPTELCIRSLNGEFLYRDNNHFRRNLSSQTNAALASTLGFDAVRRPN